jgi:hypothetical protein
MMQKDQNLRFSESLRVDRTGSVFIVVAQLRQCLGCDRLMTREAAAQHSPMICYPRGNVN